MEPNCDPIQVVRKTLMLQLAICAGPLRYLPARRSTHERISAQTAYLCINSCRSIEPDLLGTSHSPTAQHHTVKVVISTRPQYTVTSRCGDVYCLPDIVRVEQAAVVLAQIVIASCELWRARQLRGVTGIGSVQIYRFCTDISVLYSHIGSVQIYRFCTVVSVL